MTQLVRCRTCGTINAGRKATLESGNPEPRKHATPGLSIGDCRGSTRGGDFVNLVDVVLEELTRKGHGSCDEIAHRCKANTGLVRDALHALRLTDRAKFVTDSRGWRKGAVRVWSAN